MAWDYRNWVIRRIHDRAVEEAARRHFSGRLIDIGCGTKPYKTMMAPVVESHTGVDHDGCIHDHSAIDLVGSAYEIPCDDGQFDSALCTAVLEHLEEPELALRECFRVLKPGGAALYTVPFIWHIHEAPRDFYRFSEFGLRHLFEKTGFEAVEIQPLSGFWITFATLFTYSISRLNRGPLRYIPIIPALSTFIQGTAWLINRADRSHEWTWMYLVTARKPVAVSGDVPIAA